jgi:hypothetical protein
VKIVVHIDRLVLEGVGQPDLRRLQAALEQELTLALTAERAPLRWREDPPPIAPAPVDVSHGPEAIGQAIARAAHARIVAARAAPPAAVTPGPAATASPPLGSEARP